jgi:hypothetical protein
MYCTITGTYLISLGNYGYSNSDFLTLALMYTSKVVD